MSTVADLFMVPREIRDRVYDEIIAGCADDQYNSCGVGIKFGDNSLLFVSRQTSKEFLHALCQRTRIALEVNLDKIGIVESAQRVPHMQRSNARSLSVEVKENSRLPTSEYPERNRPNVARSIMDGIKLFTRVQDVVLLIELSKVADENLLQILVPELECLETLTKYRIVCHKNPVQKGPTLTEDMLRKHAMAILKIRISSGGIAGWKPQVFDFTQYSPEDSVWMIYGENSY